MKINNSKKRLLVILRSSSESTENLCENLVKNQLQRNDLIIKCSYVPFSKTLEKAYEIAYEEKYSWTLMIDSDVLINSMSIENIIYYGDKYNSLVIQGYVLDFLYGGPRSGGLHLYSYEAIDKIYSLKPNTYNKERPETFCKNLICPDGYRFRSIPLILGIHDYFQFENDYYRKILFFYTKNKDIIDLLSNYWKSKKYKIIVEMDTLIKKNVSRNSRNKIGICTTDLTLPYDFEKQDNSSLLKKISNLDQKYIDNICMSWYPEILYLKKFTSIYLRLLLKKDFAKLQFKLLIKKKRFLKVGYHVLKNSLIILIVKILRKLRKFAN